MHGYVCQDNWKTELVREAMEQTTTKYVFANENFDGKMAKKVSTLIPYPHGFPFCTRELQTISFYQHQQPKPSPTTIPIPPTMMMVHNFQFLCRD